MNLEDAIEKIEDFQVQQFLFRNTLAKLYSIHKNVKPHEKNIIYGTLMSVHFKEHIRTKFITSLRQWGSSTKPNAKDYGKLAIEYHKKIKKKSYLMSWFDCIREIVSIFVTQSYIAPNIILNGDYSKDFEKLQKYKEHLFQYLSSEKEIANFSYKSFNEIIENETQSLNSLTRILEKNEHDKECDEVIDYVIELNRFKKEFPDLYKNITKGKRKGKNKFNLIPGMIYESSLEMAIIEKDLEEKAKKGRHYKNI